MEYIISIVIGYLLGCFNTAYICGKCHGIDMREVGSHNCGASNAKITLGWPYFFIVLIGDMAKTFIAYFIIKLGFKYGHDLALISMAAAILGHMFPFYLNFNAGKGFSSYIGLMLLIDWKFAVIVVAISLVGAFATNWIVTSTYICIFATPIYFAIVYGDSIAVLISIIIASLAIFIKHIKNIKRIINKQEIGINGYYIGTKIKSDSK